MPATISAVARRFGLSRSTLLYYDRIGLLRPSGRATNRYRQYSGADEDRLERIVAYRRTGASMRDIRRMLDGGDASLREVLQGRLEQLHEEMDGLREQQRIILGLLRSKQVIARVRAMTVRRWVKLLQASGFDREDMRRWHTAFERSSPAGHQKFLEFLCIPPEEIARIRRASRAGRRRPDAR